MERIKVLQLATQIDDQTFERVVLVTLRIPIGALESDTQESDLSKRIGDVVFRAISEVKQLGKF